MCLRHKLILLSGGGVDGGLPKGLDDFLNTLMELATLQYDISDLEKMRVECWNALKLSKPKPEQVS
jgi:hypothetical protein